MYWTDLSAMIYIVPLILASLVVLFAANFLSLSSLGDIHCPVCNKKFRDVFDLRRHIKQVTQKGGEKSYSSVVRFRKVA